MPNFPKFDETELEEIDPIDKLFDYDDGDFQLLAKKTMKEIDDSEL